MKKKMYGSTGMLGESRWDRTVTAFRTLSLTAGLMVMRAMPAAQASGDNSATNGVDVQGALAIPISIFMNYGIYIGILFTIAGVLTLAIGHTQQQSPEQSQGIRMLAAGVILMLLRAIIPVATLLGYASGLITPDSIKSK